MEKIKFLYKVESYNPNDAFVATLSVDLQGKDDLLVELSKKLKFPDYFGYNWDALSECLRDFHWIKQKGIILIHRELPTLTLKEFKIYFDILFHAAEDWKNGEDHYLEIIFPLEFKAKLYNFLDKKY